jgi:hypothetical protein
MTRLRNRSFFLLLLFGSTLPCLAQRSAILKEETKFRKSYQRLRLKEFDLVNDYKNYQELEKASASFARFIAHTPATLNYPFRQLIDSHVCQITTSEDGRFRIYSWDMLGGGTGRYFNSIIQWQGKEMSRPRTKYYYQTREEDITAPYAQKVHCVGIGRRTYYLAVTQFILSNPDRVQCIQAYSIQNGKLNDSVKLFQTRKGRLNSICIDYSLFNSKNERKWPFETIRYDRKHQAVLIPLIKESGGLTKGDLVYKLKDGAFRYSGTRRN